MADKLCAGSHQLVDVILYKPEKSHVSEGEVQYLNSLRPLVCLIADLWSSTVGSQMTAERLKVRG